MKKYIFKADELTFQRWAELAEQTGYNRSALLRILINEAYHHHQQNERITALVMAVPAPCPTEQAQAQQE